MSDRGQPTIHVSVPDRELHEFAKQMARDFFGGNVSRYIVSLLDMDRRENLTEKRALQTVTTRLTENGVAA